MKQKVLLDNFLALSKSALYMCIHRTVVDIDVKTTLLFPSAIEMSGRWVEGLTSLCKKGVSLATMKGKHTARKFATLRKRRLSIGEPL